MNNPTAMPCPICGPADQCDCMTAEEKAKYPNLAMIECVAKATLFRKDNALQIYKNKIDEARETIAKRDAKIARLESLYDSSLRTIADRDTLIKHIRERYDWFREQVEDAVDGHDISPWAVKAVKAACEEETP